MRNKTYVLTAVLAVAGVAGCSKKKEGAPATTGSGSAMAGHDHGSAAGSMAGSMAGHDHGSMAGSAPGAMAGAMAATDPGRPSATGALDEASFKALHQLRTDAAPALHGTVIDLAGGKAYLSLPAGQPPFPAVLVIHEWWGMNQHIEHWADRLANAGYAALAVDLYQGKVATTPDEAMTAMKSVDQAKAAATINAGLELLAQDPRVVARKRGVIGWCFGGGWSLQTALAHPDLDATVMYYGQLETDPVKLTAIKSKLLGIFANKDTGIPPAEVDKFASALGEAKVDAKILRYDADHAFANPSGAKYDQAAATSAWAEVEKFLAANLKQ